MKLCKIMHNSPECPPVFLHKQTERTVFCKKGSKND